jgi:hypothetical protein
MVTQIAFALYCLIKNLMWETSEKLEYNKCHRDNFDLLDLKSIKSSTGDKFINMLS